MNCVITKKEKIKENIFDFTVRCPEMAEKTKSGQFLHILCGEDAYLRRPISVCEVKNGEEIRFIFQVKGKGTDALSKRREGEVLDILGPLGNGFNINKTENYSALVGGGIGIFPLLEAAKKLGQKAVVLLGFRSESDIVLLDEFKKYTDNVFAATDDGSFGYHGLVTDLLKTAFKDYKIDMVYTCGPMPMMKAVAEVSAAAGTEARVSLEERMGCGIGACVTCACTVGGQRKRVCKDGPVFNASEVEWNG